MVSIHQLFGTAALFKFNYFQVGLTLPDEPKIGGKKLKAVKELKPAGWHPRYD